ncbi:conserved hypothetical protein [Halomicrobium mukohataei DSM 12286]|uniref:Uncharacterized protein n=2 Tax=Halomicrobium mukohataei TaxID=57705 RepID=C7P074_HALMD|nr:conserved hypothetical protein [Halomicrobium mukohataei DSM 12286]
MMDQSHDRQLRAELYLRGDTYGTYDAQRDVLQRVHELETENVIDESSVADEWQRIRTLNEDRRDGALATYDEFAAWAQRNDYALEPAFERRARSYVGLSRVDDVVVFPVVSLAIYERDRLQAVFPCSDGERNYRVQDCLDAFERGDERWLTQFDTVTVDRTAPRLEPGLDA